MATRKSEWLASIKPILDRDAATRDAKELARELSDILDVSVGTDTDSLEQLIKEFNRQLKEMGKQEVVFSEKTLHGIVGQFAAAITEGISSGIAGGIGSGTIGQIADKIGDGVGDAIRDSVGSALNDVSKEMAKKLAELENRRAEIHKQTEKLDKRYQKYSDMYDILSRDEEANISPLKAEGDLDQQALKILEDFTSAEDALTDAEERRLEAEKALKKVDRTDIDAKKKAMDVLKQSTQEYNTALVKASSAAVNMYRMGETLKQNKDKVKDQSLLSEFSTKGLFETTSDVSEQWMQYFEGYDEVSIKLSKKLTLELENINAQIEEIRKNYPDIVNVAATDSAVKSLNEIAAAYDRIAKKAKQAHTEIAKDVLGAIEYEPGSESLTVLSNRYQKSRDSNEDWEVQYQWMVKFVKEYEAYLKQIDEEEDKLKKKNMRARAKRYEELYGEVKPVAQNAEQMLREIAKRAGHQFDGDTTGSSGPGGGADEAERIAEAKRKAAEEEARLRAEAEAKAKAEKEAADAIKKQRLEEEKLAKTAEKKRLEDEASRLKTYTGYRAIEPPEGSGKTKHDALTDWGGEYFSTDPKVAASYGENFFKEGNIIIGEITPKNPLVINANGLRWDEFDKMPQLKELFPGLLDLMKQPGYIGDDGQKYINEQAKAAGYDSVILENVQDALDGDIKEYGLSTTIAVLDDKIVSLTGSMAQLEAGTNRFADVVSAEIPSYYVRTDGVDKTQKKGAAQSSGDGTGTGDASSAELEAATTKAEALQDEVEQKNQELANKDAEIARIQAESEAEKRALDDAKATLQNDLDATRQQLADAEYTRDLYDSAMNQLTEESNEKDRIIYDLREQLANVKTGTGEEQASVSSEELKNVLSSIVYNVKIAHDDNDKQSNKIAVDESALEQTLKRVFANILNPQTEQNDYEPKNEPWALEKTLLSVNEVLGNIQTNTAKPDSVEVAPATTDVGNVLATENTLAAIKTAVESINTKVVKGTKAKTSENSGGKKTGVGKKNAESYAGSQYFPEKLKTQTMQLAKFRAQLMTTGKLTDDVDAKIYELLDGLKQVHNGPDFSAWSQKFQQLKTSVGITDIFDKADSKEMSASYKQLIEFQKTRNKLELQYEKAQDGSALKQFYAEQLSQMNGVIAKQEEMLENEEYEAKLAKIREEQARKLGEVEAKAADKVAKKAAADQKKLDKRRAMTGKAGSAIGRAEGVWLEAEGLEQAKLPDGFKKQVSEYYDALDKLRLKHHEINTSEVVTDEQQAELIRQTKEVNDLTNAIGPLVAEYQKLSGANVDEANSRATTLTGASSLNDYEAQLKQYVKSITDGKGQIKSFNAETKTLTYTVKTGKNEFTEYTAAVRHLDSQMVAVQGTTKRTETFLEATTRKMRELTSYFSGMAVFNFAKQELRRGIQYVREIDLALTELKKVTDETEESYDRFLETAAKTGARLGTTISAVTEATATFAKLGYSMEQATEMAEAAIVYKNVGDNIESTGDAADSIISTMKGFRLEASESMAIVDRFNEVGNRFAITSKGIGEALRLSASALSEGGNSLDESIGLITAANEVVNDPSSVGTALKTLTLRLRGSKTELEEMGEDVSDMATTTSQLQAKLLALTGGQVDIMLDENTFKNSTEINYMSPYGETYMLCA